jgi:dephospho-CoA kinase
MEANQPKIRLVIGVTGRLGAGKTTAAEYLRAEFGFCYIRYSQVLADWFHEDPNRKSELQVAGWEVMSGGLQAELNGRLIAQMTPESDWVVDGLRHPLDYDSLKKAFTSGFHLIYIDSPPEERWKRLQKHSRFPTLEEFCAADAHAVEQQIQALRKAADVCIQNTRPVQQLYEKLTCLVIRLRKEHT